MAKSGQPTRGNDAAPGSIDDVVEAQGQAVREGQVLARVFNDEDVFAGERDRIFTRCWTFVGHETEVREPGDYAYRYIGTDPFIFVRGEDGEIRVLFNSCRHKGTQVCRASQGNTTHFRCAYHGWTYKNTGELIGVPNRELLHGGEEKAEEIGGLVEAPRVDSYNGLVFASLSEDGPSLEDYLGEATWYLDVFCNAFDGGLEVVAEPHRVEINSDWKIGAENFGADAHHTEITHRSTIETGLTPPESVQYTDAAKQVMDRINVNAGPSGWTFRTVTQDDSVYLGHPAEYVTDEHLTDDQFEFFSELAVIVGTVFPNLSFISTLSTGDPEKEGRTSAIRQWQPLGPGRTELWSWVLAPADASEAYKQRTYEATTGTFSPSGNFEQDDIAVWETISEAAESQFATDEDLALSYEGGWGDVGDVHVREGWPGPGTAWDDVVTDVTSLSFHGNWHKAMTGQDEWMRYPEDYEV